MVDVNHFRGFRGETRGGKPVTAGAQPAIRADEPPSTARAEHFTNAQIAALFAVLAAIASIPILLYPWPPLGDYINHLARMHVIATVRSDPDLARFYQVDWQVIPNLMMDLIVPVLQRVMNVYLAGQTYTIMCFVVILSGTMALNRQLYGRWSVAADRVSAALQFRLSRRHDELSVRHRPFAVGAGSVGGVARARNAAASRHIDA